jgi:hypothetical protein
VIFSSIEHECEFERRVGDGEQFGKPQVFIWGQGIRVPFFFVPSFWACKKKVLAIEAKPELK